MISGAVIAGDYRYLLTRVWDESLPAVTFILMNPSTADQTNDDQTTTRCINFAKSWNKGSLKIVNLFAYRSVDPSKLRLIDDPVGPENDKYINDAAEASELILLAWGEGGKRVLDSNGQRRDIQILKRLGKQYPLHYLRMSSDQTFPLHPARLSSSLTPQTLTHSQYNTLIRG